MPMFNKEETQFLIAAVDEAVKRGGLNVAGIGLSVAMKLQNAAASGAEIAPAPTPQTEEVKKAKKAIPNNKEAH